MYSKQRTPLSTWNCISHHALKVQVRGLSPALPEPWGGCPLQPLWGFCRREVQGSFIETAKLCGCSVAVATDYLNLWSCVVTTPTSSSEGLKSMESTVDRHEIAVWCTKRKNKTKSHLPLWSDWLSSCYTYGLTSMVCSNVQSSFFFTFFSRKLVASVCFTPAAVALNPQ